MRCSSPPWKKQLRYLDNSSSSWIESLEVSVLGIFTDTTNMCPGGVGKGRVLGGHCVSSTTSVCPRVHSTHGLSIPWLPGGPEETPSMWGSISVHKVTTVASPPFWELPACLASLVEPQQCAGSYSREESRKENNVSHTTSECLAQY